MAGFGFAGSSKSESGLKNMEELQGFIKSELDSCNESEEELKKEFREVADIEQNFKLISSQIDSLKNLIEKRDQILTALSAETEKRNEEINLQKCGKYIDFLSGIDDNIFPMFGRIFDELQKLYVQKTHILYKMSKENRKMMHDVDKKSRKIISGLRIVYTNLTSTQEGIQVKSLKLKQLEKERSERPKKDRGKIGFVQ